MSEGQPLDFSRISSRIGELVAASIADEERTSRMRAALRQAHGSSTNAEDSAEFDRIRNSIAAVPARFIAASSLAISATGSKRLHQVLLDIAAYWDASDDIVSDDQGLSGRIDDALITHLLLARVYRWQIETESAEFAELAGQFDLDLRRSIEPALDVLIARAADDIWELGFDVARGKFTPWKSGVFHGRIHKSMIGAARGGTAARPPPPPPAPAVPAPVSGSASSPASGSEPAPNADGGAIQVWFGTNRTPVDANDLSKGFGGTRDAKVHYGICEVAIPKSHQFGSIGTSWWKRLLRLQFEDDHLKVMRRQPIDDGEKFFGELRDEIASTPGKQILFYLHGFNVSFDDAAIRAAQLSADLKVPGATAFFSWPSKAQVDSYFADVERIGESEGDIAAFLTSLATELEGATIHIIAHSMGNRGLARAMQRISSAVAGVAGIRFGQIILAAPDISVGLFQDLARVYPKLSKRTTMYVSARDRALGVSKWLQDAPRAGFTPPVTIMSDIDTIEVTNIDLTLLGHGYYASAEAVLYDIASLLQNDVAPQSRPRLRASHAAGNPGDYWVIGE